VCFRDLAESLLHDHWLKRPVGSLHHPSALYSIGPLNRIWLFCLWLVFVTTDDFCDDGTCYTSYGTDPSRSG
jgi:hypothetical protein